MASELTKRLTVAAIGIPLCLAVTWVGGWVFAAGLGVLAWLAVGEIGTMLGERSDPLLNRVAAFLAGLFPLAVLVAGPGAAGAVAVAVLLALLGLAALRIPPAEMPFQTAALCFTAAFYVGGLLSFGIPLRESLPGRLEGTLLFFLPVVVTWAVDTAAYTGGRAFGRRKMAPAISPNKTVEGGISGLLAGPFAALAWTLIALPDLAAVAGMGRIALLGLLLAAAAILGDLVESSLKRECGVKDSSQLLPGHGGLLDRMDSLLWTIPVAWFFLHFLTPVG
ncbi:MAG: phosphatidate cytidylyltransferase [marine benthic group bacterium]|jgi:phosphatidate cytidylyltransferase|nr:phosphatidate cytidylyltransferase [Gemmatimonadota bacterium]MCL7961453.1 phosphatidate cytidylyltransferase [Candidatus Carthagonibacter metallireducens]MCL7958196.1 phosphatidate cytidylyltransferase [Gemmatimonadota bacterium]MCL7965247.1 phosphatidate cytidylyltransferase [Gemmatimonadota bacterium]MCL7967290.1 phosphatidate cytidylyltransferase [Gemmatimonadota bacterium]